MVGGSNMVLTYKGPGVYVRETQLPQPVIIPGSLRTLAIVGRGTTDYEIANAEQTRAVGTNDDTITGTTVSEVSSVLGVGSLPGLYDYAVTTDYTIANNVITWGGSNKPADSATYYVTYRKVKSVSFYEPTLFQNVNDVRAAYGDELSGGLINEITLAAKIAFENGASQVICVQQESTSTADQQAAIDKLETEEVDIILAPGMTSTTLQSYIFAHVNRMSSFTEKKERLFFTTGLNLSDSTTAIKARAAAYASERVVVTAPAVCEVVLTDGLSNSDATVSVTSTFAGAGIAGIMCNPSYDEAEPITRKQIASIATLAGVKYKESEMNDMASNGVCVLANDAGIIRVRHALTTSTANVNTAELSIVSIKDAIRKSIRPTLDSFIGTKYLPKTSNSQVRAAITSFCEQKVQQNVLAPADDGTDKGYRNISVTQNLQDPRKMDIHFEVRPVYTLTLIEITFSLYI